MKYEEFLNKLKEIQTTLDTLDQKKANSSLIFLSFSLNGVSWICRVHNNEIFNIQTLKKDIPKKLLFTNIDIIREHSLNKNSRLNYQIYIINPDDFFNKLKF